MRLAIRHHLTISPPEDAVNLVLQVLLTPGGSSAQEIENWRLEMPGIARAARFTDAHGNAAHLINIAPEGTIHVVASGTAVTRDTHGVLARGDVEPVPTLYLRTTGLTRVPVTVYGKFRNMKDDRVALLHALMERIGDTYDDDPPEAGASQSQSQDATGQSQSQTQAPETRVPPGAEQMAHAFVGAARALDIPARYVTGYLLETEGQVGRHAWAEAYEPSLGWIAFDPLLQVCPTENHVRLAAGLDADDVRPVRAVPPDCVVTSVSVDIAAA